MPAFAGKECLDCLNLNLVKSGADDLVSALFFGLVETAISTLGELFVGLTGRGVVNIKGDVAKA